MKSPERVNERITKITIPDEDMPGWIEVLRQTGFTDAEMDEIFGRLNKEYRKVKGKKRAEILVEELDKYMFAKRGTGLSESERKHLMADFE